MAGAGSSGGVATADSCRVRARSIRQPYAELILRGTKVVRSRPTRIIGERFHLYAAGKWPGVRRPRSSDDRRHLQVFQLVGGQLDLRRGLRVGPEVDQVQAASPDPDRTAVLFDHAMNRSAGQPEPHAVALSILCFGHGVSCVAGRYYHGGLPSNTDK
jgi:hypothetical protein